MKYKKGVFLFRRDLRLIDNTGLNAALRECEQVIPVFILNKKQLDNSNEYKSDNCVQFMFNSLIDLHDALKEKGSKLFLFYGNYHTIVNSLLDECDVIYANRDYTPFAIDRDDKIKKLAKLKDKEFKLYGDYLINEPESIYKLDGKPYTVFTPFMKKSKQFPVSKVITHKGNFAKTAGKLKPKPISFLKEIAPKENKDILVYGGREEGLELLKEVELLEDYKVERDFPAQKGTSHLSAHNKFGTISIREFYHKVIEQFGENHNLINELYWRDFYTHIAYNFPHVFGKEFQKKYQGLKWESDNTKKGNEKFKAWCEGRTGFPIVDAGMRELNTTGYMHNRVRMIVSSFLIKDLHIDWRLGEKYFATKLTDYDPSVNNGSWQWAASTGCDAQPYFRIFNPWLQQKKFDKDCEYIKMWISELSDMDPKDIHKLETIDPPKGYPRPICDHKTEKANAIMMFKQ